LQSAGKMLPTTQSRCQIIRFGPVDEEQIVKRLLEMDIDRQEATYWAAFSEASLGTAIEWATLELKDHSCYGIKKELLERLAKHRLPHSMDFAEWLSQAAKKISGAWSDKEPNVSKKDITRRAQQGLIRMIIAALNDAMRMNIVHRRKICKQRPDGSNRDTGRQIRRRGPGRQD